MNPSSGALPDLLQRMTPEQLHQLMGLSTLGEEGDQIQTQLAQGDALVRQLAAGHSYGAGAGIANGLAAALTGAHQGMLQRQAQQNLQQVGAGRNQYADLLRGQGAPAAAPIAPTAHAQPGQLDAAIAGLGAPQVDPHWRDYADVQYGSANPAAQPHQFAQPGQLDAAIAGLGAPKSDADLLAAALGIQKASAPQIQPQAMASNAGPNNFSF